MINPVFQVITPVDGTVYTERPWSSHKDIERTLHLSKGAMRTWKEFSLASRKAICQKALTYFQNHATEIAEELTWQMGRPIRYTPFEITKGFKERTEYMIDVSEQALSDIYLPKQQGFTRFIKREPIGTVLVLAPWNYPYLTAVNTIIPALLAGNTVILKMSEQTPLCAERFAAAFAEAGLPEGVFQYVNITHDQVAKVISDSRIDHVAFTGSVEGGMAVQRAIGSRFISAGLELGGKDPAYVRDDADLNQAIENLVDGAFFNSGQSCCGIERIYVHKKIAQDFIAGFVALTKKYVLGDPTHKETTLGPMVRKSAAQHAQKQIQAAVAMGAKTWIGKNDFPDLGSPYQPPQVLTQVTHQMNLMQEESFAPMIGIMEVEGDVEAITLMNDSRYGLTASVWTNDQDAALTIGNQIQTGTWFMNRCDYLDPALCWTGIKDSGKGCTLSELGFDQLTRPKSFHLKQGSLP